MLPGASSGTGTALLLLGGAIFLKPRDVLVLSRAAGRVCGSGIVTLRGVRNAVAETLATEGSASEFKGMRDSFFTSFRQIEDITRTVSKEVAEASPVASFRAATTFTPKRNSMPPAPAKGSPLPSSIQSSQHLAKSGPPAGLSSLSNAGPDSSGAAIIARVIEEAAFAKQHARILGTSVDQHQQKE